MEGQDHMSTTGQVSGTVPEDRASQTGHGTETNTLIAQSVCQGALP